MAHITHTCDGTRGEGFCFPDGPRAPCDGARWSDGAVTGGCGEPCPWVLGKGGHGRPSWETGADGTRCDPSAPDRERADHAAVIRPHARTGGMVMISAEKLRAAADRIDRLEGHLRAIYALIPDTVTQDWVSGVVQEIAAAIDIEDPFPAGSGPAGEGDEDHGR